MFKNTSSINSQEIIMVVQKFNIEPALKGQPVVLRNGSCAIIVYSANKHNIINSISSEKDEPLVGFLFDPKTNTIDFDYTYFWGLDGSFGSGDPGDDIVGMYEMQQQDILEYAFQNNQPLKAYQEKFGYSSVKPVAKTRDAKYLFITEDNEKTFVTLEPLEDYKFELV